MPSNQMEGISHDNASLEVGGVVCSGWDQVDIDSEIMTPADAWSLALFGLDDYALPDQVQGGADVTIKYRGQTILVGVIDTLKDKCGRRGRSVRIGGRDLAGQLLDCSVNIFQGKMMTLEEIVAKSLENGSGVDASSNRTVEVNIIVPQRIRAELEAQKTTIEPGESIWTAIHKAAESVGQYVWFDPDGTLVIGNPVADEKQPAVVPELVMLRDGTTSDVIVMDLEYSEDVSDVYSDIYVLGHDDETGRALTSKRRNLLKSRRSLSGDRQAQFAGRASNPLSRRRLRIVVSGQLNSAVETDTLADKLVHDANLNAFTLTAEVEGWTCATGEIWRAGWLVTVKTDAVARVSGEPRAWVIFGRTLKLSRSQGMITVLKLKRVDDWMQPVRHVQVLRDATYRAQKRAETKARRKARTAENLKDAAP